MKKILSIFIPALVIFAGIFSSCNSSDGGTTNNSTENKGAYIINYGGYSQNNSSITNYDFETSEIYEFYYEQQNGKKTISAIQWAYNYNDKVYLMGNNPDQILVTDETFTVIDTISENIAKPRNCVADGDNLYISCLGEDPDWNTMPNTYILKYNISTKISEKIALAGGPEGLEIANGKLYVALNYAKKIAVMNLSNKEFTYIDTKAPSLYFAKDSNGDLYVTLASTYSLLAEKEGLGHINTSNDILTIYELPNIGGGYAKVIDISKDGSKVYVISASYNENYVMVGGISSFDIKSKSFDEKQLISGISGISGLSVNPQNGDLYAFVSNGTIDKGIMKVYNDGKFVKDYTVGVSPIMAIFIN